MTNNNSDDPLIVEIEKMHSEMRQLAKTTKDKTILYTATARANIVAQVLELVKAYIAGQQAEKEKMIAELKDKSIKPTDDPYCDDFVRLSHVLQIIQGKEQEERARE